MPTFFHKVEATRVGTDCRIVVDGRVLLANSGTWILTDASGNRRCLTHDQFLAEYEPADDEARQYLAQITVTPAGRIP